MRALEIIDYSKVGEVFGGVVRRDTGGKGEREEMAGERTKNRKEAEKKE